MGIFDFLKSKEDKEHDEALKILKKMLERKKARTDVADELVSLSDDNLVTNGQIASAEGRFGLEVTNPIPVKGFSGLDNYFDKLNLQKRISWDRLGSTSAQNINGSIDIYNVTAADGSSLERLYICMYCSETSSKLPEGF
jgi:hypothetical protein